ncbi:MAG: DEAD/DEAH box helicase [Elusimicrobia bacterium]|nr:DEAD/DEAH box helicase [Elusimicrobiota bacterium]
MPSGQHPLSLGGVPGPGAWAHLCLGLLGKSRLPAPLAARLNPLASKPLTAVLKEEEELEDLADAVTALSPLFGLSPSVAFFGEDPAGRAAALERLHLAADLVLATPKALEALVPTEEGFAAARLVLRAGPGVPRSSLCDRLARLGYRRVDFVECPGEFALRGAVVDFFPLEPPAPVRVLYDGDRIESLRAFDVETQAGEGALLEEAAVVPASPESLGGVPLSERLRGLWLVEERALAQTAPPPSASQSAYGDVRKKGLRTPRAPVVIGLGSPGGPDLGAAAPPVFRADLRDLARQCSAWRQAGVKAYLYSLNRGEDERIQEMLEGLLPQDPGEAAVQFLIGPLRRGYVIPALKLAVLSSAEIFARTYRPIRPWAGRFAGGGRLRGGELRRGDYVVHEAHGIARYLGLEAVSVAPGPVPEAPPPSTGSRLLGRGEPVVSTATMDCLKLEFRGGDKLFIPMTDFRQVQKFTGAEGRRPRLASLDARSWEDVKERVREGVREMAEQLLKLQAARDALPGRAFQPDSKMEEEFAESFPFEETLDQRKAIEEVKADLGRPHPMDRVVVGDVGFGKTEVAMRAALKCAAAGAQTAVLVPTTILADQHARTFRARFAQYPVRVETLSRFSSLGERRKILQALAGGQADIVIGTHRLLQADVRFKDLGLLVIDEEHRFGVREKERLKALRKDIHCLTLSATPIPRTLYQALSGLRSVSLMRSAPAGRQPIATSVLPYDEKHVVEALSAELARGGQAFYVHNRVRTLPERVEALRSRLKGVRIAMAHGQMRSCELEKTMWDFFSRKYDVLAASTIIESGLDIPSVNTLLIENAHEFGLSQLYQLRGRIGRERQKAFCCLYYPGDAASMAALSEEARARLGALKEFTQLGSGFQLALRDLEIRGAGDLLGSRQHGYLNSVGLEFYCQLLNEEVLRLSKKTAAKGPPSSKGGSSPLPEGAGEKKAPELPAIDIGVPAFIPEDYLPGDLERIELYKRLLAAGPEKLPELEKELSDLSGPPPEPVRNLFRLLRARRAAARLGVRVAAERAQAIEIYFHPGASPPPQAFSRWLRAYQGRIEFLRSAEGDGLRVRLQREGALSWLERFLSASNLPNG